MKPFLQAFILCKHIQTGEEGMNLHGVLSFFRVLRFPTTVPFQILCTWHNLELRNHPMRIDIRTPGIEEEATAELDIPADDIHHGSWTRSISSDITLVQPGDLHLRLTLDGELYGEFAFPIVLAERVI